MNFYDFKFFNFIFNLGPDGFHTVDAAFVSFDDALDLLKAGSGESAGDEGQNKDDCL